MSAAVVSEATYFTPLVGEELKKVDDAVVDAGKGVMSAIKKASIQLAAAIVQADPQGRISFDKKRYLSGPADNRTCSDVKKTEDKIRKAKEAKEKKAKKDAEKKTATASSTPAKQPKESKSAKARDPTMEQLANPVGFNDSMVYAIQVMLARLEREQKNKEKYASECSPAEIDAVIAPLTKILTEFTRGYDEKSPLMEKYFGSGQFVELHASLRKLAKQGSESAGALPLILDTFRRVLFEASMDAIANYKTTNSFTDEQKKERKARTEANKKKTKEQKDAEKKEAAARKKASGESTPKKVCINTVNLPRASVVIDSLLLCKYLQRSGVYGLIQLPAGSKFAAKFQPPNVLVTTLVGQYIATIVKRKEEQKRKSAEEKKNKAKKAESGSTDTQAAKASVSSGSSSGPKPAVNSTEVAKNLVEDLPDLDL